MIGKTISLPIYGGEKGFLLPLEEMSAVVPFHLRRVYCIYGVGDEIRRGFHAHKKLKQLLVCVSGSCELILDDGLRREEIHLDSPAKGLLIERPLWREIAHFSHDGVLLVVASERYDPDDYIWDYEEFRRFVGVTGV